MTIRTIEAFTDFDILYSDDIADLATTARPGSLLVLSTATLRRVYVQSAAIVAATWRFLPSTEAAGAVGYREARIAPAASATVIVPVYFPIAVSLTALSLMVGAAYTGGAAITLNAGPSTGGSYLSAGATDLTAVVAGVYTGLTLAVSPTAIAAGTIMFLTATAAGTITAGTGLTVAIECS